MRIERDPWLEEVLGWDVLRLCLEGPDERLDPLTVRRFMNHAAARQPGDPAQDERHGRAFYYVKLPADRAGALRALGEVGFYVVDVNVTFEREADAQASADPRSQGASPRVKVRDIQPAEHEAVLKIASTCFVYSRFHLDPEIPDELAHRVKRAWVESYLEKKRGDRLLVGLLDGRPAGFLAELATEARCCVIDLIGVDKACQGKGVGRALVSSFIRENGDGGALRVGTQIANAPSIRLYESLGFRAREAAYVLHAHVACVH